MDPFSSLGDSPLYFCLQICISIGSDLLLSSRFVCSAACWQFYLDSLRYIRINMLNTELIFTCFHSCILSFVPSHIQISQQVLPAFLKFSTLLSALCSLSLVWTASADSWLQAYPLFHLQSDLSRCTLKEGRASCSLHHTCIPSTCLS